jgi:FKBP-type peptidyl-prolyl cis-trans isomerase
VWRERQRDRETERESQTCILTASSFIFLVLQQVHYEARLFRDCSKFDSSRDRGEPFEFKLGNNLVIKGWERGLLDMCKGERRKLIVPSDLGYGPRGSGNDGLIPGGATLLFDVELTELPTK